ncbi:TPR repeat-containing protein [Hydrogenobacter thermophilus TK-6]|uniref:Uncharacterized protein n=2 Tax=Hydrogenobacter thermophilus TaxID=940 RepID=D3DG76_HYDTT|nr:TPR repeat-containing protein [Hydrogenobacter thermophilus TK-6]BAI68828.1 hypothetical protein HTH_0362 [Hydrogenobacter thermophilus TK-6]
MIIDMGKSLLFIFVFFALSCAEKTVVVKEEPKSRAPGMAVASGKAVENGKKQLSKGHCKQAIHEFYKALEKDPQNFEALYWLGVAEGVCGYYPQAYDRLTFVVRYAPDDIWRARVYATMGITLLYMGKEDDAVAYFEKARAIDPRNELVVAYYENDHKKNKKHKIKKRPKDREGYEITFRWMY